MGNTFEVQVWERPGEDYEYAYRTFWRGESFIAAMWNMYKAKKQGFGCVTFHWRGV